MYVIYLYITPAMGLNDFFFFANHNEKRKQFIYIDLQGVPGTDDFKNRTLQITT